MVVNLQYKNKASLNLQLRRINVEYAAHAFNTKTSWTRRKAPLRIARAARWSKPVRAFLVKWRRSAPNWSGQQFDCWVQYCSCRCTPYSSPQHYNRNCMTSVCMCSGGHWNKSTLRSFCFRKVCLEPCEYLVIKLMDMLESKTNQKNYDEHPMWPGWRNSVGRWWPAMRKPIMGMSTT